MRNLTATLCLTIAVLLGSVGVSWSAEPIKGFCLSWTKHSHLTIAGKCSSAYEKGDYATALREWKPLAEQGHAPAQSGLGAMYFQGTGVSKDYKTAVKWFRLAAEQGHLLAQANLGWIHYKGIGVSQNHKIALKYHRLLLKNDAANKKQKDLARGYIKNSEQELKRLKGK